MADPTETTFVPPEGREPSTASVDVSGRTRDEHLSAADPVADPVPDIAPGVVPGVFFEQTSLFAPITGASYAEIRLATAIRTAGWTAIVRELGHLHASEGDSPTYQRTRDVLQTFFNEQTTARWWIKHRSWFLPPDALI